MAVFTDQLGRTIALAAPPQRIVSLVPSQTELLYHMGLDAEVAGITKFCIHPAHWQGAKPRIGGTKNVNIEKIKSLNPDLVIANREENVQQQVEALAKQFPVWVSDVNTLPEALHMIQAIGKLTGKEATATNMVRDIQKGFETFVKTPPAPTVVYLIWQEPCMSVGGDTFIHHMLQHAGYTNVLKNRTRYPTLTADELKTLQPDYLFLSSEPYPFCQKHVKGFQNILPQAKIALVDGEMFSWYGSRLRQAPHYFKMLQQQLSLNA